MSRLLMIWAGGFLGALGVQLTSQFLSHIPLRVLPGMLIFAAYSAFVPAALLAAGFALGYLVLHRRAIVILLFTLAFVLAAVDVAAPSVLTKWVAWNQGLDTTLSWIPLLSGVALSCLGNRSESDVIRSPAESGSDAARRRLAVAEGAVLVAPLLVLWPFGVVVLIVENAAKMPTLLIGLALMGIAAAALIALLSLLKSFFDLGGRGLRHVPRSRWSLSTVGAVVAVVGGIVSLLEKTGGATSGLHAMVGFGVLGVPALVPLLHMIMELRWSKDQAETSVACERPV